MIESYDNILLYYSTILLILIIFKFVLVRTQSYFVTYVIYCKTGHLHNRLQLFFNFFFCRSETIPQVGHKNFRKIKLHGMRSHAIPKVPYHFFPHKLFLLL